MAQGLTPKTPKDGWALRWTTQSLELLLRDPLYHLLIGVGVVLLGGMTEEILDRDPVAGIIFMLSVNQAACALALLVSLLFVMKSDGETVGVDDDVKKQVISFCIVAAAFAVFLYLIAFMQVIATDPEAPPHDSRTALEQAFDRGSSGLSMTILATLVVAPLWPALMIRFNASALNVVRLSMMMFMQMPNVWFSIAFVTFIASGLIALLPFLAGYLLAVIWVAWTYVAAREIFGGIDENARQVSTTIVEA